jgi:hypothetical protein
MFRCFQRSGAGSGRASGAATREELPHVEGRPIAEKLGIPKHLMTFHHLSGHGTLKDTQGALRHANITTTGNVYVQVVEENVMRAVNSHATTVLEGWTPAVARMGLTGRNVKRLPQPHQAANAV